MTRSAKLPLEGIRVVEFVHMVMGPTCGLILADLGAKVIKVEPMPGGDNLLTFQGQQGNLTKSPWKFKPRGESGKMVSELIGLFVTKTLNLGTTMWNVT